MYACEISEAALQVGHWGYQAIAVSVATGQGMPQLAQALNGRISAVAGPSGVGKSSIINALRLRAQQQHAQQAEEGQTAQHAQQAQQAEEGQTAQQAQQAGLSHDVQQAQQAQHAQHEQQPQQAQRTMQAHQTDHQISQHSSQASSAASSSSSASNDTHLDRHQPSLVASSEATCRPSSEERFAQEWQQQSGTVSTAVLTEDRQDSIGESALNASEHRTTPATPQRQRDRPQHEQLEPNDHHNSLVLQDQQTDQDAATSSQAVFQHSTNGSERHGLPQQGSPAADSASGHSHETNGRHASHDGASEQASSSGSGEDDGWAKQWGSEGAGEGVQLQSVGAMSNIGRGMHTTRHVALLKVT